ncbi:PTS glucitol/sorbitol transporter subunit IIA [Leeia sp. TBRC 13508]|uniref:PTS glucitol/sorbitol transporter subunit IIA n=1 Tax=Leeia speluncae TaxID=2884804 RepID=A0ABS8D7Z6_9NEIS|nr:PTS glucitol/sorbitol transporter subunit IIA [Leeia speluncae]MCB6184336.1 PTS glucitol/sorbitol transporter subunit IIA [Leeia speluncae]
MVYYSTNITEVGPEVFDLLDGGVLILYADGAPEALAEVAVQHLVDVNDPSKQPTVGDSLMIGEQKVKITAIGETAWHKVQDLGHVVFSFNGADVAERPGEICTEALDVDVLKQSLMSGCSLAIAN